MEVPFGTLRSSYMLYSLSIHEIKTDIGLVLSMLSSALQSMLPTRPLPPSPPQSSAQLCNDNVLSVIFKVLAPKDLYAVTLTCKGWCSAAYRVLYASVDVQLSYYKGTQTIDLLSCTLIVSKDIWGLIRDLLLQSVSGAGQPEPDMLYDWLPLLPDKTITSLHIFSSESRHQSVSFDSYLFSNAAVRSISQPFRC